MDISSLGDRELVRKLMFEYEWTQEQLATRLGITQPVISRVLNNRQALSRPVRMLAEQLLEHVGKPS
jgi:transcriptional regulator with XRE-family HTH domain